MKKSKDYITICAASRRSGIKGRIIQDVIERGLILEKEGLVHVSCVDIIKNQKETLIGINAYMEIHRSERFDPKFVTNRNKFLNYFEEQGYFDIELISSDQIIYENPVNEPFYICREEIILLDEKTQTFFAEFGFTEYEKMMNLIRYKGNYINTKKYLYSYIDALDERSVFTPSFTEFVRILFLVPDVLKIQNTDITKMVGYAKTEITKQWIVDFLNYVRQHTAVNFGQLDKERKESTEVEAYSYEEYVGLAKYLFNSEIIEERRLVERAIENHTYAEMWLYLSIFYICGWRSEDICENWVFLHLDEGKEYKGINRCSLRKDILDGKITDDAYSDIATYVETKIMMKNNLPGKSAVYKPNTLLVNISPGLKSFYGKLIIIAELHHLETGNGYLQKKRRYTYQNWVKMREFFGEELHQIYGKNNISSTRLNKSYLQSLEESARTNGYGSMNAHAVAAFARNHKNVNTTAIYIRDHGLSGETAEVVISMMFERGVFSAVLYNALISAYPEAFGQLSSKEQTAVMAEIQLSAFEIETTGTGMMASIDIEASLKKGDQDSAYKILKTMYSVGQGFGKAKDEGIYCLKRALGEICAYPYYESCIANCCPYHIFSKYGIQSLINVIKRYRERYEKTGNQKYIAVLRQVIIPNYKAILNRILSEMSKEDRRGVKAIIKYAVGEDGN